MGDALTESENRAVDQALGGGHDSEVLTTIGGTAITRKHMRTLSPGNWLSDEVINAYCTLLNEKLDLTESIIFSRGGTASFFYKKMKGPGGRLNFSAVERWTKNVDLFAFKQVLIPVHISETHWTAAMLNLGSQTLSYMDSLKGSDEGCLGLLEDYIRALHAAQKPAAYTMHDTPWPRHILKDHPIQSNGNDCGMFVLVWLECQSESRPLAYSQANMLFLRRRAVMALLRGTFERGAVTPPWRSAVTVAAAGEGTAAAASAEGTAAAGSAEGTAPDASAEGTVPAASAEGTAPASSAEGTAPAGSAEGTVPDASAEGTAPAASAEGTVPAGSAEGTVPDASAEGTVPDASAEGTVPAASAEGTAAAASAEGIAPAASAEGTVLDASAEGTVPAGSAEGTVPDASVEDAVPAGSAKGTVPAGSAKGTVPDASAEGTVAAASGAGTQSDAGNQNAAGQKRSRIAAPNGDNTGRGRSKSPDVPAQIRQARPKRASSAQFRNPGELRQVAKERACRNAIHPENAVQGTAAAAAVKQLADYKCVPGQQSKCWKQEGVLLQAVCDTFYVVPVDQVNSINRPQYNTVGITL
jgi:sentrin-specific protease 1